MPFGKYKGREFDTIPRQYLEWLYGSNLIKTLDLANAVCKVLYGLTQEEIWVIEQEQEDQDLAELYS
jgi:hypothetical protein